MRRKLIDSIIKNAKPKPDGKPTYLTDGGGLYLYVTATGTTHETEGRVQAGE